MNGDAEGGQWRALQTVHAVTRADVHLTSPENDWNVATTRFRLGRIDINLPALDIPVFGVNYGQPLRLERTVQGKAANGQVAPGHVAILPQGVDSQWVFDQTGDLVLVFLSRNLFNRAVEEITSRHPRSVEVIPQFLTRDIVLERIAHQLLRESLWPQPESRLRSVTLAQELAEHLLAAHSNLGRLRHSRPHVMAPAKLKRAKDFVQANLEREISLEALAEAAGMSLFHFAKAFKSETGCSPYRYVTQQRVLKARTLLHNPALSIAAVAKAVGFTHSHFAFVFARYTGMPPSSFRDVLQS